MWCVYGLVRAHLPLKVVTVVWPLYQQVAVVIIISTEGSTVPCWTNTAPHLIVSFQSSYVF